MRKMILVVAILSGLKAFAQEDKQLISDAVGDYVDAFYTGDTARILRSISPAVVKYGYYRKKDATSYQGEPMSFRQMLDYATSVGKKKPDASKWVRKIEVLDLLDQTAAAKLTAWWGTDYILLAKMDGKWMITHVLWQSPPPAP